jgi:hypothetical protein
MTATLETAKPARSRAEETIRAIGPYRPRHLRFVAMRQLDDWRVKLYGITLQGRDERPAFLEATMALAQATLPRPALTEERYGVGLAIAHDAAVACIALVYWWENQNELHQRVFIGPREDPGAMRPLANPGAGCVWELGVLDFERRAWIADVLANPAGPDIEGYLGRRLEIEV